MVVTLMNPLNTEKPTVVICDGCGELINDGFMQVGEDLDDAGHKVLVVNEDEHYCDCCVGKAGERPGEFRTCDYCGKPFFEGYTVEGGGWYCCEGCFEPMMKRDYPKGYRPNGHEDDPHWCGGMWDFKGDDGEWRDTGIFLTDWL